MDCWLFETIKGSKDNSAFRYYTNDGLLETIAQTRGLENNNAFHVAAKYGVEHFIVFIRQLIRNGIHDRLYDLLCEQNLKGEIPLHLAAQSGNKNIVEILLGILDRISVDDRKKRNLFTIDKHGDTPLHRALRYGHQDIAILLLQRDADLAYLPDNEAGESLAYLAAENLCERFLRTILDADIYDLFTGQISPISFSAPYGMTVFHPARNLNDDIMRTLINKREKLLKQRDDKGKTVLHYAVEDAIEPMVGLLLKADSSLAFVQDDDGMTPLHRASSMGSFPIVRTILELSPSSMYTICDKGDHVGQTPLHVAKMDASFLRVFLQHTSMKKLVNVVDDEGNTPLHIALKHKSSAQDGANALLEVSAINWRLKNKDGYTPMDLCKYDTTTNLVLSKDSVSGMNGEVVEKSTPLNLSKSNDNIPSKLKNLTSEYWRVKDEINMELLDPELFESQNIDWEELFTSYRGVEGESIVHLAAMEGDMEIINKAVERDNKTRVLVLSGENPKAETPLHVAAAAGKLQVVEAILKLSKWTDKFGNKKPQPEEQVAVAIEIAHPPNHDQDDDHIIDEDNATEGWEPWNMKSANGDTPLHCALRNGYEQVAMRLIETDRTLIYSSVNKMNESPLYLACLTACSNVVLDLLSKSSDDVRDYYYNTMGTEEYHGDTLSTGGPDGQNALHAAIRRPPDFTTSQKLSNAPSFNFEKSNVSDPNQSTTKYGFDKATDRLIDEMPELLIKGDKDGKTPFYYAVELGKLNTWSFVRLVRKNCRLAALMYDNEGFTPLLRAAANGSFKCASNILCYCGISSVDLRHASNKSTMLHLLKVMPAHTFKKWVQIIERFPKIKKMINEIDKDGNTPLHCAILESDIKKTHLLLSIDGVRLTIQNKRHQTPMDLCTQLMTKGDSRHLAIWIALEDFVAKEEKRRSQVPLLLRMNTRVMMSYSDQGMSSDEDLKKLLENVAVAAALMITLTFAATFTIPGGYDGDTGQALRLKEASVKTFVASNVVAMLLGVGVLLTYTFGATKKAWLRVLSIPCVVMLQCALLATIVSFVSGVYALVFQDARWIATMAVAIVGGVLLLFSTTPAAAGAVIQILKWLRIAGKVMLKDIYHISKWMRRAGEVLLAVLLIIPYYVAKIFEREYYLGNLIQRLSESIWYSMP